MSRFQSPIASSESIAHRQLNTIRDPVERLPLEISSEIFLQCLPSSESSGSTVFPPKPHRLTAPMLLLNICNAWTDVALSTPALWAAIRLDCQGARLLQCWLQRARHCALSISLGETPDDEVTAVLRQYAEQIKHLDLYADGRYIHFLPSFPCLEILAFGTPEIDNELALEQLMRLLSLTPNLVECILRGILRDIVPVVLSSEKIPRGLILPSLRCLEFEDGNLRNPHNCLGGLFLHLTSPALETLVFSVDEWLRFLPSLTDLQLFAQTTHSADDLLSALADSDLVPKLRSLKLEHFRISSLATYEKVLAALSCRHTELVLFSFWAWGFGEDLKPHPDVWNGLEQLVADGMKITISGWHSIFPAAIWVPIDWNGDSSIDGADASS
ncbi:hypothetical protein B0H14DRAFT_2923878 [Mycena olivaceomarginata]|nr:hypothetical protein B0H14DRAFT_2923878 [Mycena olivaceomarginata]